MSGVEYGQGEGCDSDSPPDIISRGREERGRGSESHGYEREIGGKAGWEELERQEPLVQEEQKYQEEANEGEIERWDEEESERGEGEGVDLVSVAVQTWMNIY
ncbi:hypothetical protein L873DRAFT_1807805 [Choiromyces venosus 120613-1]|uniref:Uncharacterized protein n=1 Tax=Choiromyces venosus 120613-1 TaxID=1336337 RepID=A0A3N4JRG2_9PEZI|nr:hypothetical protein L873DRAFT_1807805 [Choiromyces venosus 120613-1]